MKWNEKTFGRFVYVSSVSIADDGRTVSFLITKANFEKDKYENTIVIKDAYTETEKYINDATLPKISPNGKWIAFVRNKDKKSFLCVADTYTLSERKLCEYENIRNILWSPDSKYLLIVTQEKDKDEHMFFVDDVPVWFDGMGFLSKRKEVLRVIDFFSGEELNFTETDIFTTVVWHSATVVFSKPKFKESLWARYDTFIFDPKSGDVETLFENTGMCVVDSDGKRLLFHGKPTLKNFSEHRYLYVYDGKELISITERFVFNNSAGKLDSYGNVYFTSDEKGKITLKYIGKSLNIICGDKSWVTGFDVSKNGNVVFIKETERTPGDIYFWDGNLKKLTYYNDELIERLSPVKAEYFSFKSDDLDIDGWYLKPDVEEEKKAPVVLFVHGGPKGMYGYRYNFTMQFLAKSGFYVVYFNPRGSTGYDEDFALRVLGRTGKEDFQDIMNGLEKFFKIVKDADRTSVGITGISYGGFMTNWAVTQTDTFKAAVSENGVSNWINMYGVSDISLVFVKEIIGEDPLENEIYRELSPVFHAKNVKTPLLLIHSLEDYRCPLDQSLMFYNILKDLGKEVYIAIFKKGAHGHSVYASPKHRVKRYKLIKEFFVQKLVERKKRFVLEEERCEKG